MREHRGGNIGSRAERRTRSVLRAKLDGIIDHREAVNISGIGSIADIWQCF